jgi:hypothetical protein
MGRQVSKSEFESYRSRALDRWCQFQGLFLAYTSAYETCRKYSSTMSWATAILAILTAALALLQAVDQDQLVRLGTVVLGLFTGATGILKQTFKWDERATRHRDLLVEIRDGRAQIRRSLERMSEGRIEDEDETLLARMDSLLQQLMTKSELQLMDAWDAAASGSREYTNLEAMPFRSSTANEPEAGPPTPASEAPAQGINRIVRG